MSERKPHQFSDEEREEIGSVSRMLAECGQPAIDELVSVKIRLCMESYRKIDTIKSIPQDWP